MGDEKKVHIVRVGDRVRLPNGRVSKVMRRMTVAGDSFAYVMTGPTQGAGMLDSALVLLCASGRDCYERAVGFAINGQPLCVACSDRTATAITAKRADEAPQASNEPVDSRTLSERLTDIGIECWQLARRCEGVEAPSTNRYGEHARTDERVRMLGRRVTRVEEQFECHVTDEDRHMPGTIEGNASNLARTAALVEAFEDVAAEPASDTERRIALIEEWADKMRDRGVEKLYDTAARYHLGLAIKVYAAEVRRDTIEACALAIEADRDRVMATGMPSLGESCIYDVCALTVRQTANGGAR